MAPLKKPIVFETTFARYTAEERIGEGGAGTVYRAKDDGSKEVAIKVLDPSKAASADRRRRFKNELLFGIRNQHKNVITVIDHGLHTVGGGSTPFYVMPFYALSLRTLIAAGIKQTEVLPLFNQCLDGVEAAHLQSVIHRDMKPENILHNPNTNRLVIADFGIAEFTQEELYTLVETKPNARLANFQYSAPEQRQRGGSCDARTDVFALGLILNEMFTKTVPHGTGYPTIGTIASDFAYLDDLVAWMIRQNPSDRPSSIEAIKRELIGRGNAFVEQQQLSRLKQTVVPRAEIDDPIIADPIRIVDVDWQGGILTFKLNQLVNPEWVRAIQSSRYSHTAVLGKGPGVFQFQGDTAFIGSVRDNQVQDIVNHFKSWLPSAHAIYSAGVKEKKEKEEQAQRQELARQIQEREQRRRTLETLKF